MEKRNVAVILGDWSYDGHNESRKTNLTIIGNDVSDTALVRNRKAFSDASGIKNPEEDLFANYEEDVLKADLFETLLDLGITFKTKVENAQNDAYFAVTITDSNIINKLTKKGLNPEYVSSDEEPLPVYHFRFSALDFLMSILGFGDSDFSYEIIPEPKYPVIVGAYRTPGREPEMPMRSFGYGLMGTGY